MQQDDFSEFKVDRENFYKSIIRIQCPYFQEYIHFNARGLEHLKFRGTGHPRSVEDQNVRLGILHFAPTVMKLSRTVQGVWHTQQFERVRKNGSIQTKVVAVSFYEFVAVIETVRVKIIVKQINGGEKFFWSIFPFWKRGRRLGDRIFHTGDPEND